MSADQFIQSVEEGGTIGEGAYIDIANAEDYNLQYMWQETLSGVTDVDLSFDDFMDLSNKEKSNYLINAHANNLASQQANPVDDQEFSNSLINNASESTLQDDDEDNTIVNAISDSYDSKDTFSAGPYTIESGDTLSQIAEDNNISVRELKMLNGIRGDDIQIGQQLILPGSFEALEKEITASDDMRMSNFGFDSDNDGEADTYLGRHHLDQLMIEANGGDMQATKYLDGLAMDGFKTIMKDQGYGWETAVDFMNVVYDKIMNPDTHEHGLEMMNDVIAKIKTKAANAALDGDTELVEHLEKNILSAFDTQMDYINNNLTSKYNQYNQEIKRRQ